MMSILLSTFLMACLSFMPAFGQMAVKTNNGLPIYTVMLKALPVVAYEGTVDGYPATKATGIHRFQKNDPKVKKYISYLKDKQQQVLKDVGVSEENLIHQNTIASNSLVVRMTSSQAKKMASHSLVWRVSPIGLLYEQAK